MLGENVTFCTLERDHNDRDAIKTNFGNILCMAYQSCTESNLIWTDDSGIDINSLDYDNNNTDININDNGNIFCMAISACSGSVIEATNTILYVWCRLCL